MRGGNLPSTEIGGTQKRARQHSDDTIRRTIGEITSDEEGKAPRQKQNAKLDVMIDDGDHPPPSTLGMQAISSVTIGSVRVRERRECRVRSTVTRIGGEGAKEL